MFIIYEMIRAKPLILPYALILRLRCYETLSVLIQSKF